MTKVKIKPSMHPRPEPNKKTKETFEIDPSRFLSAPRGADVLCVCVRACACGNVTWSFIKEHKKEKRKTRKTIEKYKSDQESSCPSKHAPLLDIDKEKKRKEK